LTSFTAQRPRSQAIARELCFCALIVPLLLAGCDPAPPSPPVTIRSIPNTAIVSLNTETLTPAEQVRIASPTTDAAYRLGPSDAIGVTVYLHPDLTVPQPGVSGSGGGALITSDGSVELPLIGQVHLGGLTLSQAHDVLTAAYSKYIENAEVALELVQAQSLRYYLLGAFTEPGVKYPNRPLSLLEALALGGSVDLPNADLYQAYVAQGSVKLPVDLHALLVEGDLSQNITLAPGDVIVIPSSSTEDAFIFGSVLKPGPVPFGAGHLDLLQALSASGLDLPNYENARLERIHIIRAHGQSAEFIVVNADLILKGEAAPFALEPGDIVFVPPTPIASWNAVLNQILPSLSTISGVLNPFVQIKFLNQ